MDTPLYPSSHQACVGSSFVVAAAAAAAATHTTGAASKSEGGGGYSYISYLLSYTSNTHHNHQILDPLASNLDLVTSNVTWLQLYFSY